MKTEDVQDTEESLVLHEMPNGVKMWCGSRGEEEAFFIYGEVFEDRTYARMGVRVRDGDTVWDVGERESDTCGCACSFPGKRSAYNYSQMAREVENPALQLQETW